MKRNTLYKYNAIQEALRLVNEPSYMEIYLDEIKNSLDSTYLNRLNKWIAFFNDCYDKSMCMYSGTIFSLLEASLRNHLFRTQTTLELETSLNFYEKLLFGKHFIYHIENDCNIYLLNMSLVIGKYPGMLLSSTIKQLETLKGNVSFSRLKNVFETLFIKYENPKFLTDNLNYLDVEEIEAIMHINQGKNIRTFEKLPIPLSKKESFILLHKLPDSIDFTNNTLKSAIITTKLMSSNGNSEHLVGFLRNSRTFRLRIDQYIEDIKFWKRAYELVCESNFAYLGMTLLEFVDYFEYKKYHEEGAYSLKNRTPESIVNAIHNWHELASYKSNIELLSLKWTGSETPPLKVHYQNETYSFKEITEGIELYKESQKLKHCAFSYIESCYKGHTSIWSLKKEINATMSHYITIEVTNQEVVQIAGKRNRSVNPNELELITQWAENKNFTIRNDTIT